MFITKSITTPYNNINCCMPDPCMYSLIHVSTDACTYTQVSQVDHESVQATALKVVFDLLHVFGFEAFHMGDPNKYPDNNAPEAKDEVMCCFPAAIRRGGGSCQWRRSCSILICCTTKI